MNLSFRQTGRVPGLWEGDEIPTRTLPWSEEGTVHLKAYLCGLPVTGRIMPPKDICVLIPRPFEYAMGHGRAN